MEAESENLRKRTHDEPKTTDNYENNNKTKDRGPPGRSTAAMARRGLPSLAIAVTIPLSLHLAALALFHTAHAAGLNQPTWFRSLALQAVFVALPALMGFCAWLVWADGGFHRKPAALAFFLSYLALSLAWDPIVFGLGALWVGFVVSWAMLGALIECHVIFKEVNPVAGNLVAISMIWAVFVVSLNLKLLFW